MAASLLALVRRWRDEVGDVQRLGLVRLALGFFLFREALHDVEHETTWGYFGARFHIPIVPEAWVPSTLGFGAIEAALLVLGTLVVVGIAARPALFLSGIGGIFLLCADRMRYHHHIYTLYLMALVVAFMPCDRSWVRGRRFAADDERTGPLWAVRLLQLQLTIIYLTSGGSKLLDADWRWASCSPIAWCATATAPSRSACRTRSSTSCARRSAATSWPRAPSAPTSASPSACGCRARAASPRGSASSSTSSSTSRRA